MGAKADLIGYVGGDATLRDAKGRPVLSFRMATTDPFDKSTSWWSVAIFGPRAESLKSMITKGKHVYVCGSMKQRTFTANGEERTSVDINAYDVQLLDKKEASGGSGGSRNASNDDELGDVF